MLQPRKWSIASLWHCSPPVDYFSYRGSSMNLEPVLCRSFQVVPCLLQIFSGCFLLTVGRFMSFLSCSRLFQVLSGCFLLVVVCFKSFLARCRSFQVVPLFSKYETIIEIRVCCLYVEDCSYPAIAACNAMVSLSYILWLQYATKLLSKWNSRCLTKHPHRNLAADKCKTYLNYWFLSIEIIRNLHTTSNKLICRKKASELRIHLIVFW